MNQYIATFFTHFGAVRFSRTLKEQGIDAYLLGEIVTGEEKVALC